MYKLASAKRIERISHESMLTILANAGQNLIVLLFLVTLSLHAFSQFLEVSLATRVCLVDITRI